MHVFIYVYKYLVEHTIAVYYYVSVNGNWHDDAAIEFVNNASHDGQPVIACLAVLARSRPSPGLEIQRHTRQSRRSFLW